MKKSKTVSAKTNIFRFVNREEELAFLEKLYQKTETQAQFLVLYGKRRVGKTEVIKQFFKNKPKIYYLASKGSAKDQLRTVTEIITRHFGEEFLGRDAFSEWRTLFDYLGKKLKDTRKRIVLVFDEFPYLADSEKAVSSYFQYGWDECLKNTRVMLVLMGSSIAMMYKHALSHRSPLYARRTSQWLLEPFTFAQSKNFFDSDNFERVFSLYSLAGGVPAYLKEFNVQKNVLDNIEEKVLTKGAFLYLEPELLLADEFKEPRKYLTILKAVGLGRTKYSELLNSTGFANNILSSYLRTLIDLKIVKREVPVTEKNPQKSKKGSYSLADSFLRFYFSFVFPDISLVESGAVKTLFNKNKGILAQLIAKAYEDTTAEFIKTTIKQGAMPHFEQMGRWWDKDTEIDLVGLNKEENSILFVETKWNNKPLDSRVLQNLKNKAQKVDWGTKNRKEYFALVAKGGFSKELIELAKKKNVLLIAEDKPFSLSKRTVKADDPPDNIPVLDIEPGIGGTGGPSGHFVHFHATNIGEKVAIDCQWGIRGFAYEWRSPEKFMLRPGDKKKLEYKISSEKPFQHKVPELNIFFEYKDNKGRSYFTRRELIQEKKASFYNITRAGAFHPAVVLRDTKIRNISEPYMRDNLITRVDVEVEVNGETKTVQMGIGPILIKVFGFSEYELKAAFSELVQRKVRNMLLEGKLENHIFKPGELPKDKSLSGFEAYKALRDSLDR